jgi:type IV pilus biogenesis protein CpaD/CtpE
MAILVLLLAECAQQPASSTVAAIPKSYRLDVPRVYAGLKDINKGNQ